MGNLFFSLNGPAYEILGSFFDITFLATTFGMGTGEIVWRLLQVILVTVIVALLAYYSIKIMGLARGRHRVGSNVYVVESIVVGQQSMVQLIKAGDKYLVIGVTKERVTLLSELDESQVKVPDEVNVGVPFGNVLNRFLTPKDEDSEKDRGGEQDE